MFVNSKRSSVPVAEATTAVQECDATDDDSSNTAGPINIFSHRDTKTELK